MLEDALFVLTLSVPDVIVSVPTNPPSPIRGEFPYPSPVKEARPSPMFTVREPPLTINLPEPLYPPVMCRAPALAVVTPV